MTGMIPALMELSVSQTRHTIIPKGEAFEEFHIGKSWYQFYSNFSKISSPSLIFFLGWRSEMHDELLTKLLDVRKQNQKSSFPVLVTHRREVAGGSDPAGGVCTPYTKLFQAQLRQPPRGSHEVLGLFV